MADYCKIVWAKKANDIVSGTTFEFDGWSRLEVKMQDKFIYSEHPSSEDEDRSETKPAPIVVSKGTRGITLILNTSIKSSDTKTFWQRGWELLQMAFYNQKPTLYAHAEGEDSGSIDDLKGRFDGEIESLVLQKNEGLQQFEVVLTFAWGRKPVT